MIRTNREINPFVSHIGFCLKPNTRKNLFQPNRKRVGHRLVKRIEHGMVRLGPDRAKTPFPGKKIGSKPRIADAPFGGVVGQHIQIERTGRDE